MLDDSDAMETSDFARLKRIGHVAIKYDKYIFVWGGYNDMGFNRSHYLATDEIWLYEYITEKWYKMRTSADDFLPLGISGSCGLFLNDKLYINGGYCVGREDVEGYSSDVYALDRVSLTWKKFHVEGPRPISCDKMVGWVHDEKLYYFGGFGLPPKPLWSVPMAKSPCQFCYETMPDDSISRRGWNNQLVMFDPKTQKWKWPAFKGPPPIPRAAHAAAQVGDKVYIFGGRNLGVRMNDLHRLDLRTMTWSGRLETKGRVPDGRSWHSLTAVSDTTLVLYGGFSQQQDAFSDCWRLDLTSLTWTRLTFPFLRPRLWHTACLGDPGEVIIFGGSVGNILNPQSPKMAEYIITLWFSPMSLLRLSLNSVMQHRDRLETFWQHLPHSLQELLRRKSMANAILESCES